MEHVFNVSKLIKFLHQTLVFTEEVRITLKSNCDEAMYCLKPWYTDINPQQEISKDVCTCSKSEIEVEEIVAGISKALIQTQQLRKKLSFNVTEKNPNRFNTYECYQDTGNKKQQKIKNLSAKNKDVCPKQDINVAKPTIQKMSIDKGLPTEIAQRDTHMTQRKIKNDNKQLLTHSVKLTGSKNFLAINKRNIKNIKLENNVKSNSSISESKCKFGERHSAASTNELKNLIQKVSVKPNDCTLSNEYNVKCPLADNITSQYAYKQNLITVIDSFNMINIPEGIIKSLKIYHAYLNIELSEKLFNNKRQKVFDKFLVEFNKMDEIVQKRLVDKNHITIALLKFMSLFQSVYSKNIEMFNLNEIKSKYTELNSLWKIYEMKEFNNRQILKKDGQKTLHAISNTTESMSNGIWNFLYNTNVEGISKICCIPYTNTDQLLLFFDVIQQLQHMQYYEDLIKIIVEDVLPNMNIFSDSTQLEYVKIYKMISILYQGLNPKIPVLVRTDK